MKNYTIDVRCAGSNAQYYDLKLLKNGLVERVHCSKNRSYVQKLAHDWMNDWADMRIDGNYGELRKNAIAWKELCK